MSKRKKQVEYRYFPSTSETGVLGGIVADSLEAANLWSNREIYRDNGTFQLIRVRLEYTIPSKAKSR